MLPRDFYTRPALRLAPELLGKLLVHETDQGLTAGMITEVEAYAGPEDDAAHSFKARRTERTAVQYRDGGYAYVFGIYGMHWCFNAVCGGEGKPEVVLVRALEPVRGIGLMRQRRGKDERELLCSGPGRLCQAMGITKAQYGMDLCGGTLYIRDYRDISPEQIALSPRVNIDYAQEYRDRLWRFYIRDSRYVSRVPGRYAAAAVLADRPEL